MNNKEPAFTITNRQKDRQHIEDQVQAYLAKGGKIEVLSSAFDRLAEPKCRFGDDTGILR